MHQGISNQKLTGWFVLQGCADWSVDILNGPSTGSRECWCEVWHILLWLLRTSFLWTERPLWVTTHRVWKFSKWHS